MKILELQLNLSPLKTIIIKSLQTQIYIYHTMLHKLKKMKLQTGLGELGVKEALLSLSNSSSVLIGLKTFFSFFNIISNMTCIVPL